MSIVGAYATAWRFIAFGIGAVVLILAFALKLDFGGFPYLLLAVSGFAMNGGNRDAARNIRRTIVRLDDRVRAEIRAGSTVLTVLSVGGLVLGSASLVASALPLLGFRAPSSALTSGLALIATSAVLMFTLEGMAIRLGWFEARPRYRRP